MKDFNFLLQNIAFLMAFGFLFMVGNQYLSLPVVKKTIDGTCIKVEQPEAKNDSEKYDCQNLPTKYETVIVSNEYKK